MGLIEIEDLADERLELYRDIKDPDFKARLGLFVVEGRFNIRCLIEDSPFEPLSVLTSAAAHRALRDVLDRLPPAIPIYRAPSALLQELSGFHLHRGCLALGRRPEDPGLSGLVARARPAPAASTLIALEGLTNHDNVGGIFRNAMAFGADGVIVCPRCCDPLYRKGIRTSMGGALCVPFARAEPWPAALSTLREAGYARVALDPLGEPIAAAAQRGLPSRAVLLFGTEGAGLSEEVLAAADLKLGIGMEAGVDSLNVATSTGIALHYFRQAAYRERSLAKAVSGAAAVVGEPGAR
jgi:tRNA G18 (ribose-2'-O)-methylase SpoU